MRTASLKPFCIFNHDDQQALPTNQRNLLAPCPIHGEKPFSITRVFATFTPPFPNASLPFACSPVRVGKRLDNPQVLSYPSRVSIFDRLEAPMSFSKAQDLIRLARLAAARRGGVSLEDISLEFEVSHRTAQRMTDALE